MHHPKPLKPAEPGQFYGHSPNRNGKGEWQTAFDHIHGGTSSQPEPGVALRAAEFAKSFGMGELAFKAGLLHDLGKYAPTFTARLEGGALKLDHWTAGAWVALYDLGEVAVALAIEGHHVGLQQGETSTFHERFDLRNPTLTLTKGLQLTEPSDYKASLLKSRWQADLATHGVECPKRLPTPRLLNQKAQTSEMLGVRMLFSTLVDADFLETERHFGVGDTERLSRPEGKTLKAESALNRVREALARLARNEKIPVALQELRRKLGENCLVAAQADDLLWTMTAPTGSGKTLAMLLFALERAAREPGRFRRIVIALPYLSILDQTAKIYRELFPESEFGPHYVLEHHSLAGAPQSDEDPEEDEKGKNAQATADRIQAEARLLTENWAAPIILTTNVQLFESLHANRPSTCRKLHNLAGSIILCDEVQTLPTALAVPTLRTLSALATPTYNTAVVFATATQPAFSVLHAEVAKDSGTQGWTPREIVADPTTMFADAARLRPIHADWTHVTAPTPWVTVAEWLKAQQQGMIIVNLRRHSRDLAERLRKESTPGLEYISTYLCPAHRREVLGRVNIALDRENPKPCRLVATQCVEAGVDLDFPLVCRALAPLDAIAQASGRCNRNGVLGDAGGVLRVFRPEDDGRNLYPDDAYRQAAERTGGLAARPDGIDLTDPEEFTRYFRAMYALNNVAKAEGDVHKAIDRLDFESTAKYYRLIDKRGINVVIPYGEKGRAIWDEIASQGLNRERIREAREFTVSVFADEKRGTPPGLRPLTMAGTGAVAPDWYLLENDAQYDSMFGLSPQDSDSVGPTSPTRGGTAFGLNLKR